MYGVEIQIVDDDYRILPRGETGWLRARGLGSALGVEPPDPADRTHRLGWHYPGDYAVIDEEGFVFLQGRDADLINVGGVVVFAPEIERTLAACPGVRDASCPLRAACPNSVKSWPPSWQPASRACDRRTLSPASRVVQAARGSGRRNLPRNSSGKILRIDCWRCSRILLTAEAHGRPIAATRVPTLVFDHGFRRFDHRISAPRTGVRRRGHWRRL
jgi:hypothetical protein